MSRRARLLRAIASALLIAGGVAVVVLSLLPSHPRAVTATVSTVNVDSGTVTVSAPGSDGPLSVTVGDPAKYQVGAPVVVTVRGGERTAVIGNAQEPLVNLWTGVCAVVAGVLVGLPLVRSRREARAPAQA